MNWSLAQIPGFRLARLSSVAATPASPLHGLLFSVRLILMTAPLYFTTQPLNWQQLPCWTDRVGFAAACAGNSNGTLILGDMNSQKDFGRSISCEIPAMRDLACNHIKRFLRHAGRETPASVDVSLDHGGEGCSWIPRSL